MRIHFTVTGHFDWETLEVTLTKPLSGDFDFTTEFAIELTIELVIELTFE